MKNNIKLILVLLVVIIVGAVIYSSGKRAEPEPAVVGDSPIATNDDITGCYVARLAKDVYTLSIDTYNDGAFSGRLAYNNYQKDSSSGAFGGTYTDGILLGNYSFDSEGTRSNSQLIFKKEGYSFIQGFGPSKMEGDKSVFVDTSKVSYDPKSTFIKSDNCLGHFTDSNKVFSFDYNAFFKVFEGDTQTPVIDWRQNSDSKIKGILLATLSIPRGFMPDTNFSDTRFTVGRSTDPLAIKNCLVDTEQNKENKVPAPTKVTISGYPFMKFSSNGAGAGNFYETTSYRGIVDGDCYAIDYTIHSTNLGNYSPEQGIKQFDKTKIEAELSKIINSFKFIINSD